MSSEELESFRPRQDFLGGLSLSELATCFLRPLVRGGESLSEESFTAHHLRLALPESLESSLFRRTGFPSSDELSALVFLVLRFGRSSLEELLTCRFLGFLFLTQSESEESLLGFLFPRFGGVEESLPFNFFHGFGDAEESDDDCFFLHFLTFSSLEEPALLLFLGLDSSESSE